MASKYSRVLVHLRKTSQGPFEPAKFSECIFDHFGLPDHAFIECQLENNKLLLQPTTQCSPSSLSSHLKDQTSFSSYKIMHPPFCPVHHLEQEGIDSLPQDISNRGVDVGVAVLLESNDGQLLLTRRAAHMRTFPGVWVPPGGHVEENETLEEAVLRELEEETGLQFSKEEKISSSILGLWESVYPPILAMGQPKRHHMVVYLHMKVLRSSTEMSPNFKLCPEEVDAAAWLSQDLVKIAVWNPEDEEEENKEMLSQDENNEKIHITLVNQEGEHISGFLDSNILRNRVPTPGVDIERISTGSRFALSLWLEKQTGELGDATHRNLYTKYTNSGNGGPLQNSINSISDLKNKSKV